MANLIGRTLGPYKLEGSLGKGGMAMVYRAFQTKLNRPVAIKVMAPEIANEPGFVERFSREAEVIARLEHPHILPVIDYGEADGLHYLVMRLMDGGSLEDRMRDHQLSYEEIAHYLTQTASALDYAHKRGVIHRDMKPNNVLLDGDNNVYLTDFGIARLAGSERKLTATGSVMGTPAYMSPEQAMGRPVDSRSDIYAVGVMLYEMVANRLPFNADTPAALIFQHVYEQPRPIKDLRPDTPDSIVAVLDRAMAKSPDSRYQTATEMAEAFADAAGVRSTPRSSTRAASQPVDNERTMAVRQTPSQVEKTLVDSGRSGTVAANAVTSAEMRPEAGASLPNSSAGGAKRSSLPILIGIFVVVLLLVGGGAFLAINNKNNNDATGTAVAFAAQQEATGTQQAIETATQQAVIVLSYTPTATNTPTPTATSTFTNTPDLTSTALIAQLTALAQTAAAFDARQTAAAETATSYYTATLERRQTGTAQSATLEASRQAALASAQAIVNMTASAPVPTATSTPTVRPSRTPTATRTPRASRTPTGTAEEERLAGLLSNNPNVIIQTLRNAGILPSSGRAQQVNLGSNDSIEMTGSPDDDFVFYQSLLTEAPSNYTDFVFSTTFRMTASDGGLERTGCGLLYHGSGNSQTVNWEPDNMAAFWLRRNGTWVLNFYRDRSFKESGITDSATALRTAQGAANRLTVVYVDGILTVYVNGSKIVQQEETNFDSGEIGYFFVKGAAGTGESCVYSNTMLWKLGS
ncbi:MAG: serine/threonine-protein kinase [Anaerolineae bacterium]